METRYWIVPYIPIREDEVVVSDTFASMDEAQKVCDELNWNHGDQAIHKVEEIQLQQHPQATEGGGEGNGETAFVGIGLSHHRPSPNYPPVCYACKTQLNGGKPVCVICEEEIGEVGRKWAGSVQVGDNKWVCGDCGDTLYEDLRGMP